MTDDPAAAEAVKAAIANLREEAWTLAQKYILDNREMTLQRIADLKRQADLLAWAAEGRGGYSYSLENVD